MKITTLGQTFELDDAAARDLFHQLSAQLVDMDRAQLAKALLDHVEFDIGHNQVQDTVRCYRAALAVAKHVVAALNTEVGK